MASMNMVQALNDALRWEMEHDDRVVVLGEDVGRNGGVFRVTDSLAARFGESRVLDTPLAESGIVGVAIGMAVYGLRPVAEIQFMGFIYPAVNQLVSQAARMRARSRGRFSVPLVVRAPCGGGVRAPELHSDSVEAMFVHTPGLKVVMPSTPSDAKGLLIAAIRDPDPVLFLEPMKLYRAYREEVPEGEHVVPLGTARLVQEGEDVTVVTYGAMVPAAMAAARQVEAEMDATVEVIDLRTLWPLDEETLLASVEKTGRLVIVHEAARAAGVGAEVAAIVLERAVASLKAPVRRVTGFDVPVPFFHLEDAYLPDPPRIARAVAEVLSW